MIQPYVTEPGKCTRQYKWPVKYPLFSTNPTKTWQLTKYCHRQGFDHHGNFSNVEM